MMYTRTTTNRSVSANRGRGNGNGSGRGPNGATGHLQRHNALHNEMDDNKFNEPNRRNTHTFNHNKRGNQQFAKRGTRNSRGNNFENSATDSFENRRIDSNGELGPNGSNYVKKTAETPAPISNNYKDSKYGQNNFFQKELVQRFTSMLAPLSFVEDEVPVTSRKETNSNTNISSSSTAKGCDFNQSNIKIDQNKKWSGNVSYENNGFGIRRDENGDRDKFKQKSDSKGNSFRPEYRVENHGKREHGSFMRDYDCKRRLGDDLGSSKKRQSKSSDENNMSLSEDFKTNRSINSKNSKANLQSERTSTSNASYGPSPKFMRNVSMEDRLNIMKHYGFDTDDATQSSSNSSNRVSNRTTPRIRHNLQNEPSQSDFSPAISKPSKNDNSKLKLENPSAQMFSRGANVGSDVSGVMHLNINRPARNANERVSSRAEALERIERQYEIQRAEHEAKIKEKEAKKREEYLARYKHVDQGHRLNDNLLDEAAGYDPGYQYETIHEVRQRQQEELMQQAFDFQQREKEKQEQLKRLEEKKAKEKLNKYQHVDSGYKLGRGENQAPVYHREVISTGELQEREQRFRENVLPLQGQYQRNEPTPCQRSQREECDVKKPAEKQIIQDLNVKKPAKKQIIQDVNQGTLKQISYTNMEKKDTKRSISPELLLEDETEEEFLQRQEEQLILEALIQSQIEFEAQNKQANIQEEEIDEELKKHDHNKQNPSRLDTMNPFIPNEKTFDQKIKQEGKKEIGEEFGKQNKQLCSSTSGNIIHNTNKMSNNQSYGPIRDAIPRILPKESLGAVPKQIPSKLSNENKRKEPQDGKSQKNDRGVIIEAPVLPNIPKPLETRDPPRNNVSQIAPAKPITQDPEPWIKNPASCVLRNKNGAVLVLRPSSEQLSHALAQKLEVQDEIDKFGYSANYKPMVEQEPVYSNNRFDGNLRFHNINGAKSETKFQLANDPMPSKINDPTSTREPCQEVAPAPDLKAELRAARLRFQQNYEEALKKIQEEKRES